MKRKQFNVWLLVFLFLLQSFSLTSFTTLRAENMGQVAFGDITAQHDVAASEGAGDYTVNWTFKNNATAAPETPPESQDIVLVVDRSRPWNAEAEAALNAYMSQVLAQGNNRLGLVAYGLEVFNGDPHTINVDGVDSVYNEPQGIQNLTSDLASLQSVLANSSEASGGVPEPLRGRFSQDALQEAAKMLEGSSSGKIVFLARGLPNYSFLANAVTANDDAPYAVDNAQQQYPSLPTGFTDTVLGNGMSFYFNAEDPALNGLDYYDVTDPNGAAPAIVVRHHATALQGEAFKVRKGGIDLSVIGYDLASYSNDSGLGVDMIETTLRGMIADSADYQSASDTSGLTNALNATISQAAPAGSAAEPVTLSFFDVLNNGVSVAEGTSPTLSSSTIPQETLAGLALSSEGNEIHLSSFSLAAGQDVRLSYEISIDPAVTGGSDVYVSTSSGLSSAAGESVAFEPILVASPAPPAPTTGSVVVSFFDNQGNPLANAEGNTATTILADVPLETYYNVSPPEIPGYSYVGPSSGSAPIEGSVVVGTTEVQLVYEPVPQSGSVVAHFVDAASNPIANNEGQSSVNVLTDAAIDTFYQFSPPAINGYNYVGLAENSAAAEGSVVAGTTNIYLVYELAPQTGSVVAHFVDAASNPIANNEGQTSVNVLADAAIDTFYQFSPPVINGYNYVGLAENSAAAEGSVVAGTTNIYLVYELAPQTGSVVASFVDESGTAVANNDGNSSVPVLTDSEIGTQYAFEAPAISGYDYVGLGDGSAALTGSVVEGTTNITLVYRAVPQTGSVVASFVDEDGNAVNNNDGNSSVPVLTDSEIGTQYAFEAPAITGYDYVGLGDGSAALTGSVVEGTTNITLVYRAVPQTGSVVANFVDEDGNAVNNNDGNSSVPVLTDSEIGTQYAFEAPAITGYDYVGLGEGSAELTGSVVEGTTNITLVYRAVPQTGSVVANFVDEDGNAVNNNDGNSSVPVLTDSEIGTQYAFEAPAITGYDYVGLGEGSAELTGSVVEGTTNITLVYRAVPQTGSVVANFVDEDGNAVNNNDGNSSVPVLTDSEIGTQYAFEAPAISGYDYVGLGEGSAELTGSVVEGTTNITLVYRAVPQTGSVVASFVDESGTAVANNDGNSSVPVLTDSEIGTQYAFEAPAISGYDYVGLGEGSAELTGSVVEGTTNITLVYRAVPQTGSVVANFVDEDGNAVNNNDGNSSVPVLTDSEIGTQYAFEAPAIDDYEYVGLGEGSAELTGSVVEGTTNITLVYRAVPQTGSVVANFVDEDGNAVNNNDGNSSVPVLTDSEIGTQYAFEAPAIDGFDFVGLAEGSAELTGSVVEGTTNITLVYRAVPQTGSVVANFVDEDGNAVNNNDGNSSVPVLTDSEIGTQYAFEAPVISGYDYVGLGEGSAELTGSVAEGTTNITLVYRAVPQTGSVVANFVDEDGNAVNNNDGNSSVPVLTDSEIGTQYAFEAPAIDGFDFVGLAEGSAELTGSVAEGTTNITLVYRAVPQTGSVVANFVDEDGNAVNNNDGNSSVPVLTDSEIGTQYAFEAPAIDGFDFVGLAEGSAELTGSVVEGTTNITLVYRAVPQTGSVVANFVDEDGNAVNNNDGNSSVPVLTDSEIGTQYAFEAPAIDDYEYVGLGEGSAELTGSVVEGTTNITLVYRAVPQTGSVVANFVDEDGNAVNNNDGNSSVPVLTDSEIGTQYAFEAPAISGYDYVGLGDGSAELTGSVVEGTTNITLVYRAVPQTGSVVANFVDEDGNAVNNNDGNSSVPVLTDSEIGTQYAFEAPAIDGFDFVGLAEGSAELTGSVAEGLTEIVLEYRAIPETGTVVARFVDGEGTSIKDQETVADGDVGTDYTFTAPEIANYRYIGLGEGSAALTGQVAEGEQAITLVYEAIPETGTVVARFVDGEGTSIKDQETVADGDVGTDYTFTAPEIANYRYIGLGEGSAALTGQVAEGEQAITLVYEAIPETGTVVARFVDGEGTSIKDQETVVEGDVGTDYTFTAPEIANYRYIGLGEGSAPLTGQVAEGEQVITLIYEAIPETGTVVARFVDGEGTSIKDQETVVEGDVGTDYTFTAPEIANYRYIGLGEGSAPLTGQVAEGEQVITLIYEAIPETGTVVARFVDGEGTSIKDQETVVEGDVGTDYTFTAPEIANYRYIGLGEGSAALTGQVAEGEQVITLVYEAIPETGTVVARFVDGEGTSIKDQETVADGDVGTDYTFTAPEIANYRYIGLGEGSAALTGQVAEGEQVITLVYEAIPETGTVVARFVDGEGTSIKDQETVVEGDVGTDYTFTAPEIANYRYIGLGEGSAPLTGQVAEGEQVITLIYEAIPETGTVVARFVDGEGNSIKDQVTVADGDVGTDYVYQVPEIENYRYDKLDEGSAPLTGEIKEGQQVITIIYAKKTGSVVARFIDADGNLVADQETVAQGDVGTAYTFDAKAFEGYIYVGIADDSAPLSGEISEGEKVITLRYDAVPETGSILVKYENTEGESIRDEEITVENATVGTAYTVEPPTIDGYTYSNPKSGSRPLSGEIQPGQNVVTLVYRSEADEPTAPRKLGKIILRFEDTAGASISEEQIHRENVPVGETYKVTQPEIDGYKFKYLKNGSRPAEGTVIEGDNIVTFVYEPAEEPKFANLILRFEDEDGLQIQAATTLMTDQIEGTEYKVEVPTIDGFEFLRLKNGSAPLEGTFREGNNIITAVYKKIEAAELGSIYVRYYDEGGQEIRDADALVYEAEYGTAYQAVPPVIENYEYVGLRNGSAPVTGTINREAITVSFVYKRAAQIGSVQVSFLDPQQNKIREDLITHKDQPVGSSYAVQLPHVAGYTFSSLRQGSAPLTGTIQEGVTAITAIYQKEAQNERGGLILHYRDDQGNTIKESQRLLQNARVGTPYLVTIPAIQGHTFQGMAPGSAPTRGTLKEGENVLTFLYKKNVTGVDASAQRGSVIVHYVDEMGRPIIEDVILLKDAKVGTRYTAQAPVINGYEYLRVKVGGAPPEGQVKEGDQHVTFVYRQSGTAASGNAPIVATGETLSPLLWIGIALLVLAVALFIVRLVLKRREERQFEESTFGRGDNPFDGPGGGPVVGPTDYSADSGDDYPDGSSDNYPINSDPDDSADTSDSYPLDSSDDYPLDPSDDSPIDSDDSLDETTLHSFDEPTVRPIGDPTLDSIEDPTVDPIEDPMVRPIGDPTLDPVDDPTVDPLDEPQVDPSDEASLESSEDYFEDFSDDNPEDPRNP